MWQHFHAFIAGVFISSVEQLGHHSDWKWRVDGVCAACSRKYRHQGELVAARSLPSVCLAGGCVCLGWWCVVAGCGLVCGERNVGKLVETEHMFVSVW